VALLTSQLFGYDQGVFGAVVSLPSFRRQFNEPSPNTEGVMAAIYDIGCFVGCIVAFLGAERFGRKGSLMWGTWIMVLGTILQAAAYENVQMILSRVVSGIGNGINTCVVPMWQAECFQAQNRGAMLVIQSALIALGHPLSTFMGLASSQAEPNEFSWRWPIAFQGVFCVFILVALPWLPESPRWLVAHDRADEAQEVFARLAGKNGLPSQHPHVLQQLNDIKANVAEERRIGEATWTEVFTEGKLRNLSRVLLGAGPYMFNQWSGINSLAYFLPITFERNIGLSRQLSLILAGVLGLQYFLVS
jgi:MFS family permease